MEIENSFTKKDNLLFLEELLKTHKEKIKCIYIDLPFTTKRKFNNKKGEFAYEDTMDDENFLHFLEKRISIAYHLLSSDGFFFLHIDNKIGHYVKILLDQILEKKISLLILLQLELKKMTLILIILMKVMIICFYIENLKMLY